MRYGADLGVGIENDNVDDGVTLQVYTELDLSSTVMLRGALSYYEGDTRVGVLEKGTFSMSGIEGAILLKIPAQGIYPYVGAGAGYYSPDNALEQDIEHYYRSTGRRVDDDLDSGLGLLLLGGVSWPVWPGLAFGVNARYLFLDVDNDVTRGDLPTLEPEVESREVDLDMLFVSAGFMLVF